MSVVSKQPVNPNFLNPANFRLLIHKAPHVNWYLQDCDLPALDLPPVEAPTPFSKVYHAGDEITYDTFRVVFKIDEDLKTWFEITNWMIGLGFPEDHQQYANLVNKGKEIPGHGLETDMTLTIMTSHLNPLYNCTFQNAFPIRISSLKFDHTRSETQDLSVEVIFRYDIYTIERTS